MTATAPAASFALRPLGLGELLDHSLRLYRQNFLTCLGIAALAELPVRLFPVAQQWLARAASPRPAAPANPFITLFGLGLVDVLLQVVIIAALAPLAAGQPTTILGAYRRLVRAWRPLLDTLVGVVMFAIVLIAWCFVPLAGWLTGPGALVVYLSVVAPLAGAALTFEQRAGFQALRRAWDLTRRRFWPALVFTLILLFFVAASVTSWSFLINLGLQRLPLAARDRPLTLAVLQALLNLLTGTLILPLYALGKSLLYIDLRVRTEGLDLALAAQPADQPTAQPADQPATLAQALQASPPPLETRGWLSGLEFRRFFGITALGGLAFALLAGVVVVIVLVTQGLGRP